MKTLMLLRHAKAEAAGPGQDDRARPLAIRGQEGARALGIRLWQRRLRPDHILASDAARTRATAELVSAPWRSSPNAPVLQADPGLYLSGAQRLLDAIRQTGDAVGTLLVVGHNPDMQEAVLRLSGSGDAAARTRIAAKFPTGGLAILGLPIAHWADLAWGGGELLEFTRPSDWAE